MTATDGRVGVALAPMQKIHRIVAVVLVALASLTLVSTAGCDKRPSGNVTSAPPHWHSPYVAKKTSLTTPEIRTAHQSYLALEGHSARSRAFWGLCMELQSASLKGVRLCEKQLLELLGPPEYWRLQGGEKSMIYTYWMTGNKERWYVIVSIVNDQYDYCAFNRLPSPLPKDWKPTPETGRADAHSPGKASTPPMEH